MHFCYQDTQFCITLLHGKAPGVRIIVAPTVQLQDPLKTIFITGSVQNTRLKLYSCGQVTVRTCNNPQCSWAKSQAKWRMRAKCAGWPVLAPCHGGDSSPAKGAMRGAIRYTSTIDQCHGTSLQLFSPHKSGHSPQVCQVRKEDAPGASLHPADAWNSDPLQSTPLSSKFSNTPRGGYTTLQKFAGLRFF